MTHPLPKSALAAGLVWLQLTLAVGAAEIHFNRLGFQPDGTKTFLATSTPDVGAFDIVDAQGQVVFSGELAKSLNDPMAAEQVRRGDFTALTDRGAYRVRLSDGSLSEEFTVGDDVLQGLYQHAVHGLYLSRCGYAVRDDRVGHPACHMGDGVYRIEGGKKIPDDRDVTGAWHNGGDYRRSTLSAAQAVARLLWVVEFFPETFGDAPSLLQKDERTNGLPDLLVEARWGLDWLMRMMDESGGVSLGLGPAPDDDYMPPRIPPQDDVLHNYIGAVQSSNTAKAGAVLARASRLFRGHDDAFADRCLEASKRTWAWLADHPTPTSIPRGSTCQIYVMNVDAEARLFLAEELFRATGEEAYHAAFKRAYLAREDRFPPLVASTQTMRQDSYREILISYVLDPRADEAVKREILANLTASCDEMVERSDEFGYGNILPPEHWKHRHTIGNNLHMAFELLAMHHITGDEDYLRVARGQLDYILGANPLDKVFVTGMTPHGVQIPHYRPYTIREMAPIGLTVKGPTHDAQFLTKVFKDAGRPAPPPMKAYADVVTAHWCNEPDVEVQGYLVLFAAYFHLL